jgi:hypothetical protein
VEILRLILTNAPLGCLSGKAEKKRRFFFPFLSQKERKKLFAKGVSRLAGSVQQSYVQQS